MEWARAGALIAAQVYNLESFYSQEVHDFMRKAQAGDAKAVLFPKRFMVMRMLEQLRRLHCKDSNWVTAWIANCEFRQAEKEFGHTTLWALCKKAEVHEPQVRPLLQQYVALYEAKGCKCLCRQVCRVVQDYVPSILTIEQSV